MSAHDQMRAMLDQLMGTGRNGEVVNNHVKFNDPRVCKSFLLSCCPHDVLSSTRMDLGECPKIHDLALMADYKRAAAKKDYFYDLEATEHLEAFISDCDRRTEEAKLRLAETQEELTNEVAQKAKIVNDLAEQIGNKLAQAEKLGADGFVDDSMKLMSEIDSLRKNKLEAEQVYRNSMPTSTYQQQKLRVCEVCSAFLGVHDNDRRLADHFGGKLHLGFITIRQKLSELQANVEKRREQYKESLKASDRSAYDSSSAYGRHDPYGSRYQQRYVGGRELDRRAKSHQRLVGRDRDRDRERDRLRDRDHRDRERARDSRSISTYRSRSRSRSRCD